VKAQIRTSLIPVFVAIISALSAYFLAQKNLSNEVALLKAQVSTLESKKSIIDGNKSDIDSLKEEIPKVLQIKGDVEKLNIKLDIDSLRKEIKELRDIFRQRSSQTDGYSHLGRKELNR
jgi:hypothetical protein